MLHTQKKLTLCLGLLLITIILLPPGAQASTDTFMQIYVSDSWGAYEEFGVSINDDRYSAAESFSFGPVINGDGQSHSAFVYGSFNLYSGVMKLKAEAQNRFTTAFVSMRTYEDIHPYWINDPLRTDPINISVIFHADGVYQAIGTNVVNELWSNFTVGVDHANWQVHALAGNLYDGVEDWTANLTYTPGVNTSLSIIQGMVVNFQPVMNQYFFADFSHTGTVQVVLPEAVAFTSDSGVFLTQTSPVPLPGTLLLLGTSLLPLWALGWRSHRPA